MIVNSIDSGVSTRNNNRSQSQNFGKVCERTLRMAEISMGTAMNQGFPPLNEVDRMDTARAILAKFKVGGSNGERLKQWAGFN